MLKLLRNYNQSAVAHESASVGGDVGSTFEQNSFLMSARSAVSGNLPVIIALLQLHFPVLLPISHPPPYFCSGTGMARQANPAVLTGAGVDWIRSSRRPSGDQPAKRSRSFHQRAGGGSSSSCCGGIGRDPGVLPNLMPLAQEPSPTVEPLAGALGAKPIFSPFPTFCFPTFVFRV
jgi:hypothetical protein